MIKLYTNMAMNSISRAKLRSLLTMLGVIIGITSVVMIFALGEGFKRQVAGQLKDLGSDIVVVRSGNIVERDEQGLVTEVNFRDVFSQSVLGEADLKAVKEVEGVAYAAPLGFVSASVQNDEGATLPGDAPIIATTPQIQDVLNRSVEFGEFFTTPELGKNLAVLGPDSARALFGDDSAVGRIILIKNTEYVVRGVMERADPSPLDLISANYNSAVFIPLDAARSLSGGTLALREIQVRVNDSTTSTETVTAINQKLSELRGTEDFSVLESADFVSVLDRVFGVLTTFVGAVAGISLLVGGIGIMNIMLVSVSERTKEIGIRKSVGATNQQILGQFLVEAIILTMIGGLIGILASVLVSVFLRVNTDISPVIQPRVVLYALAVTLAVGIVFGLVPALKAARKDPIESLR